MGLTLRIDSGALSAAMAANRVGLCDPEMHRGIRSPGAPGFGYSQKVRRAHDRPLVANGASEFVIVIRQRVGFAISPHGDVMRLTLSHPANRGQSRKRVFEAF